MKNIDVSTEVENYLNEWLDVEYVEAPVGHTSYGLYYEIKTFKLSHSDWKKDLDIFLSRYDSINKVLLYTIEEFNEMARLNSGNTTPFIKIRLMMDGVLHATS